MLLIVTYSKTYIKASLKSSLHRIRRQAFLNLIFSDLIKVCKTHEIMNVIFHVKTSIISRAILR